MEWARGYAARALGATNRILMHPHTLRRGLPEDQVAVTLYRWRTSCLAPNQGPRPIPSGSSPVSNELVTRHVDDGNLVRARQREIAAAPVG